MTTHQPRRPAGSPAHQGGQFASAPTPDAAVHLADTGTVPTDPSTPAADRIIHAFGRHFPDATHVGLAVEHEWGWMSGSFTLYDAHGTATEHFLGMGDRPAHVDDELIDAIEYLNELDEARDPRFEPTPDDDTNLVRLRLR